MAESPDRQLNQSRGFLSPIRTESTAILRLAWSAFWKVTASATAVLFSLFILIKVDFRELSAQGLFGALLVFGYCLFYAACAGAVAAAFVVGWRFWGIKILLPLIGALLGAIALVALGVALLTGLNFGAARPGVHGGGQIAAMLLLAGAALVAIIGAALGGLAGALFAIWLGLRRGGTGDEA